MEEGEQKKKDLLLPVSILIAAVLIAGSLVYSTGKNSVAGKKLASETLDEVSPEYVKEIDKNEHVLGDISAPVKIIEFSDLECPFCKRFHQTMKQVMEAYEGKVVWVYRHFPIDQLHSKARKESEASECAGELGGNEKFWEYVDKIYEVTPSNNGLDPALLPKLAEEIGLNKKAFEGCLKSGKYAEKIASQIEEAEKAGAKGTPYSIIITKKGKRYAIPGAFLFEDAGSQADMKRIVEAALKN
ncbi:hypothetical protein A3A21_01875 [Candidatus Jorgensenbacteria bacterium RIFCSPLOWO2_01_FULL_45_25b]|uniref:Thioredoxin domain-containing protein n=1 Tax=Candidatus Jorgensenbacteria bacterium RIFCSPLOWO2_01_FULL_45_25b TaxID=1798471 RepID=A0A1F6BUY2_9BACT|nr:MAG: hypothetical protein A3A21_01875 [Candidatus Jorgensenbacteria bacterium RIFCSPLOWO2_01_FULL_45_25b]